MILPVAGMIASLLLLGNRRKKKEMIVAAPLKKSAEKFAEQAFDNEFEKSGDDDLAAEKAIKAYQRAGGRDPEFIAQIPYWTGSK